LIPLLLLHLNAVLSASLLLQNLGMPKKPAKRFFLFGKLWIYSIIYANDKYNLTVSLQEMSRMLYCHSCKKTVETGGRVGRTDTCPHCDADLHCCLNCRFYDDGSHNKCREPQAERVVDKESSNFCDCFSFADRAAGADARPAVKRNPLDGLFKK
jgi:hypothetical protein